MKTKAAMLRDTGLDWEIAELELDEPKANEVLIRWVAAGLCHSDEHLRHGDIVPRFPIVGGHEGAGVIEKCGPGVSRVKEGDHVVTSFLPVCGHCRWCATGHSNICDYGATILDGCLPDGTFRFHSNGSDVGAMCMLGSFSQYSVISETSCVSVDKDLPLDVVVLVGCGVPTGWCSSVYAADVTPGETVVIYGIGGIGANAVQGAAHAGAANVIAVDPLANKREAAEDLGATHTAASAEEAHEIAQELTRGVGADKAIITVDIVNEEVVGNAVNAIRKGGTAVITGLADPNKVTVQLSGAVMTLYEKTVKGTLFGSGNPMYDIRNLIGLYQAGKLKLDELITNRYALEDIGQGFQDMLDGKNIRGVVVHEH
ncbi:NDMA-dependent alcohol dehydrogenase [Solirubrobacter phytolaccae]|uniref:NDMA-dependent alcohol dehydrogenase n=1 Tax=Solirubrobacter phytolaccae TaxID=1404360 RepID=A0A9X3S961_9ACTN|nr:NDMA-dependent alcohol dehydrogenase [Solirubrobacter phytolaccae]MDA0181161.1 NDMA-dependent alcohol dehydrogenase [Solirubrobacter phytolaccae]